MYAICHDFSKLFNWGLQQIIVGQVTELVRLWMSVCWCFAHFNVTASERNIEILIEMFSLFLFYHTTMINSFSCYTEEEILFLLFLQAKSKNKFKKGQTFYLSFKGLCLGSSRSRVRSEEYSLNR